MQIVKLDAIDSTNAYIKRTLRDKELKTNTVVVARDQYQGRGQMGTNWYSEPGKNLTFSVLKKFGYYLASDQFFLSMLVCLSIYKTLKHLSIPNLSIKWPNDILSGNDKVCGVLIETIVAGNQIKSAIVGIGLNVNQTKFPDLSGVTSLKGLTGSTYNHDEILQMLLSDLKYGFRFLREFDYDSLRRTYESKLFMKDQLASFELDDSEIRNGKILGITREGKLRVAFDNEAITNFYFKEIKLLY